MRRDEDHTRMSIRRSKTTRVDVSNDEVTRLRDMPIDRNHVIYLEIFTTKIYLQ